MSLIFQTCSPIQSVKLKECRLIFYMSNQENLKKGKQPKPGEVDHQLLPKVTSDEIDLEIDTYRDDEIARDKPPHHN